MDFGEAVETFALLRNAKKREKLLYGRVLALQISIDRRNGVRSELDTHLYMLRWERDLVLDPVEEPAPIQLEAEEEEEEELPSLLERTMIRRKEMLFPKTDRRSVGFLSQLFSCW